MGDWWVERDDGEQVSGPYATKEQAERVWRNTFDTSEYRVVTEGNFGVTPWQNDAVRPQNDAVLGGDDGT